MASTYPVSQDTGFPGWPYVDYIEYVTAEQANSWIDAIQKIETVVGYGPTNTSANPLYSAAFNTTFGTIGARLNNVETATGQGLKLNTSASNIQPVGSVAAAGNSGLAADAKHVHLAISPNNLIQIGTVILWPGLAASFPSGYLALNGQLASISQYSTLYGVLDEGSIYGTSGGSFYLPNYNNVYPLGAANDSALGVASGSSTITTANLPSHNHPLSLNVSDTGHSHGTPGATYAFIIGFTPAGPYGIVAAATSGPPSNGFYVSYNYNTGQGNANISASGSVGSTGGGSAFVPPSLGVYFLVRAI